MSTVTCRTSGCSSNGVPVPVTLDFTDVEGEQVHITDVVCGACSQPITDISDNGSDSGSDSDTSSDSGSDSASDGGSETTSESAS